MILKNTDVRAKVVSKVTGSNKEYATEYFTNYPTKSKILLVPIMELDIMKIK